MSLDSSEVLNYLVRTGIWSKRSTLKPFKHVVIDAESVVKYIYMMCIRGHLRRSVDLYSATLINYIEFSNHVTTIFDFLLDNRIVPIIVYEGKLMELPYFGFQAARFASCRHQVENSVLSICYYHDGGSKRDSIDQIITKMNRPNLALNMFKTIVNMRRRLGLPIQAHQAFYNSLPLMAKLASDFKCPIITNNCDIILMDVRAGFILLDELWSKHIKSQKASTKTKMTRRASSIEPKPSTYNRSTVSRVSHAPDIICRFHYHSKFIHQHPGLNQVSVANLFPLTTTDFIAEHSESLVRLKIYQNSYTIKDLSHSHNVNTRKAYRMHHNSANRLERAIFFLTTKDLDVVGNMIRGEEQRLNSNIYNDYKQLYNYYLVACNFKKRLKIVLKFLDDPTIFNYIEQCFTMRESTSDYLLDLICCSIGRIATFSYNKSIQFECLRCKHSAYYTLDESKRILMSLLSANQSFESEVMRSLPEKQRNSISKYSAACLTIIDREYSKIVERTIPTTYKNDRLDLMRDRFQLINIAKRSTTKQEKIALLNLIFKTQNLMKLPPEIDTIVMRHLEKDEHHIKLELSIVLSLFRFSFNVAAENDEKFKNEFWVVAQHMENAIVEHYLYRNCILIGGQTSLSALVDLIVKNNFEASIKSSANDNSTSNLAYTKTTNPTSSTSRASKSAVASTISRSRIVSTVSQSPKLSGSAKQKSPQLSSTKLRRFVRHLIELLNTSLEGYYELNAFLDYPLPKMNLHIHYNPILIFNLSIHSFEQI